MTACGESGFGQYGRSHDFPETVVRVVSWRKTEMSLTPLVGPLWSPLVA